ncbi:unnamed protein product [Ambrosiozyma monospora]|uniref:Unnamed protein product n=1 Tax=Ambrosiozyma monospora TaxID=43982 RepID=A0ACB5UC90_AMBMO|nr:unnamed protein product [Ambrosiozyma monospora]
MTEEQKRKARKHGVVRQAKVINEVKGSGEFGRSRGYGFLEFKDHRHALMGLRWLNTHEVTIPEILEGLDEEQAKLAKAEGGVAKRRLIVEFAIENAQVVKRRFDTMAKRTREARDNKDFKGEKIDRNVREFKGKNDRNGRDFRGNGKRSRDDDDNEVT